MMRLELNSPAQSGGRPIHGRPKRGNLGARRRHPWWREKSIASAKGIARAHRDGGLVMTSSSPAPSVSPAHRAC